MPDFDDLPPDATVMRPRPGAGRRRTSETPSRPRAVVPPPEPEQEPLLASSAELLGTGLNPLVQAAGPVLLLAGHLRGLASASDVAGLRRHTLDEIRRFEERARSAGVSKEVGLAARYTLCASLDEAVLSTPWGAQGEWAQQTLLVTLHREAWGGEKFFDMLDRISQDPSRHLDLMELQYLCLAFGFEGKYHVRDRGHVELAEVQRSVYQKIREHRGVPERELSLRWQGVKDRRNPLIRYVPWWVVGAAVVALLAIVFVGYSWRLTRAADTVMSELARVRKNAFTESAVALPAAGPTLSERLRGETELSVTEVDGVTTVRLPSDMFASGSSTVKERDRPLLERIGRAINDVPGRVRVVGHTDDQPPRFSRFGGNLQLSRARADSVVAILRQVVAAPAQLESDGMGSDDPLPPDSRLSEADNRARNRRVDITHVRGAR